MVECRVEPSINSRGSDASVQKQGRLVCDLSAISDGVLHISSSVMPTEIIKRYFKEKSCLLDLMELGNKTAMSKGSLEIQNSTTENLIAGIHYLISSDNIVVQA
uniref:Uncharacterized protein n=1 Tax=Oryza sativa subsp. japonica TaxID=39947 RepID=Q6K239_ORYSJ|nr:hypothetical protein [Oryza sativa Japonica Group]BAD20119.1 hypothetical protein [Oryza sativa Japonica Group]